MKRIERRTIMTLRKRTFFKLSVAFALIVCTLFFLISQTASAHANLRESSPEPSEELDTTPERVIIWFTEPIEAAFSSIKVIDTSGADVTVGDTAFDATEPTAMWIQLAPLDQGTFTVVWRNVSSIDGHKVTGSFLFAVGESLSAGSVIAIDDQPLIQSPFDPLIRWVIYIGIAVFAGGLLFDLLIAARVARVEDLQDILGFAQQSSNRFSTVALGAIIVVVIAQIAQLALQTAISFDDGLAAVDPTRVIDVVAQSDWGRFWSWRFAVAVLAAFAIFAAQQNIRRNRLSLEPDEHDEIPLTTETPFGIAAIALGGIYLLLIALTSHNAATPSDIRWFAIATDLIHIVAATIWIGGIAYLATASIHAMRSSTPTTSAAFIQLASRFAPLAIFATIILVASGVVSSLMQVTIPEALTTPYGRVLGAKIFLLVILIALAAKNNRSVAKSSKLGAPNSRSITRFIGIELGVAFAILLATAGLASLEPARQFAERNSIDVVDHVSHIETVSGATIDVKLDPGNTGTNTLTVNLTDSDGNPFTESEEVRARLKFLDEDFGELFLPLENPSPGRWVLDNVTIGVAGAYQLDITVVRSDAFDSHVSTRFSATSQTFATDLIRPSAQAAMAAFGVLIAVSGIAYFVVTTASRRPIRFGLSAGHGIATLVAVIGVVVVINASVVGIGLPTESNGNPFPLTQDSVDMGIATYTTTCATCHGDTGKGDGPAGLALNPPPADLAIHIPLHTDNELYSFIADGIEGTPMVAQLGNLTSEEIWHLVNYIRTISD